MRQIFLPAGLLLAALAAFVLPGAGLLIAQYIGVKLFILTIFLVSGYQTGTKGISLDKGLVRIIASAAAVSLLLAPLLGLALSRLISLPQSLLIGLLVICSVPPTLSSGIVITEVSKGNTVLALVLTISLNLLGIFTLPFMLDLCLSASGPVTVDRLALLLKMLLLVLLPFAVGRGIRSLLGKQQVSPHWSYLNSSCVILVVYSSLAASRGEFSGISVQEYALILFSVAFIHLLLLAVNSLSARLLGLARPERKALILVASQKTFPVSLAVLTGLGQGTGNAVIVCLMFHFFQLLNDSLLASYLRGRSS